MKIKSVRSLVIKIVCCVFMAILIAATIVGNVIAYSYELQLDAYLCPPKTDSKALEQASEEGQAMAKRMLTDGAVLVRNEGGVLPLSIASDTKVNVFGYSSVDWAYGALGTGVSGQVRPENDDAKTVVDFMTALNRYGINAYSGLQNFYKSYAKPRFAIENANGINVSDVQVLCEPPISRYPQDVLDGAKAHSNTAIVVISRTFSEHCDVFSTQTKRGAGVTNDATRTNLQISTEEEQMLRYVGENFEKTIVIINTGSPIELEFTERIPGLDACLMVGTTGTRAVTAVPELLYGDKTPSGHLVDTLPYSQQYSPASYGKWFGNGNYSNGGYGTDYIEGIYVGYKWYETAYADGVWNSVQNEYGTGYDGVVQYPFGHGLSYTTFDWNVTNVTPAVGSAIAPGDTISIDVNVTNSGSKPGKEVVQAYVTVPYTKGGIEKSYVSLVGFAKTAELAPGASQTVTVEIEVEDFESYDCYDKNGNGHKGYELEAGDYEIKLMTDSHNIKQVTVGNKTDKEAGVFAFEVSETIKITEDPVTGAKVGNLFTGKDAIDGFALDGIETDENGEGYNANIPFMTRADFADGYTIPERTDAVKNRALTDAAHDALAYSAAKAADWDNAMVDAFGDPVTEKHVAWGSGGNLKLAENGVLTELGSALGADYDDPRWKDVLDQVTFDEAFRLLGPAQSGTAAVDSVGKPRLHSYDSIIQMKGYHGTPRGTGNPCSIIYAQTWDSALVYDFALAYGNEMKTLNAQTIYGPGCNIHRSLYGGRNFEYLSEDTYMTSKMLCMLVRGIQDRGCTVEIKHFLLNESETLRYGQSVWVSEQALREIYLTPFRKAVTRENASGIMTSYNAIGSLWAGGSSALLTGVLRKEWKFNGIVDTDWTTGTKGTPDEQLRAGGDIGMAIGLSSEYDIKYSQSASSNRLQYQMREAVHHVLYSWLAPKVQESRYVPAENSTTITAFTIDSWRWWPLVIALVDGAVGFGCAIWLLFLFFPVGGKQAKLSSANAADETADANGKEDKE